MKDPSLKLENSGEELVLSLILGRVCKVSLRRVRPFSEILKEIQIRVGNTEIEKAS